MSLLQLRRERKRHQPHFVVKESLQRGGRIGRRWRANRGIHSTVRQEHKGKPAMPTSGYGSPRAVRGLHPSGLRGVLVHTVAELLALREGEGAMISATVGNRAKLQLLSRAVEKKIPLLNVRDPTGAMEKIKSALAQRSALRQEWLKNKSRKQEERQKKADEKKKKEKKEEKRKAEEKSEVQAPDRGSEKEQEQKKAQEEEKEIVEKTLIKPQ
ncbi:MAG: eL32 family ribosomal protein [Nanoarchaeota archaeon]